VKEAKQKKGQLACYETTVWNFEARIQLRICAEERGPKYLVSKWVFTGKN
jgi:hypothetical protein